MSYSFILIHIIVFLNSGKLSIYVNGKEPVALRDATANLMRSLCVEYIKNTQ